MCLLARNLNVHGGQNKPELLDLQNWTRTMFLSSPKLSFPAFFVVIRTLQVTREINLKNTQKGFAFKWQVAPVIWDDDGRTV